jgi:nickel/cobalt transporter (NicO) family protein
MLFIAASIDIYVIILCCTDRTNLKMSAIAPLLGIIGFGLSHGINPSHGWPVAVLYAMRTRRPLLSGVVSSSIIAGSHFASSIVVVVVYIVAVNALEIQIPEIYMKYGAAVALGILAYVFWKDKGEDLSKTQHGHLHEGEDNSMLEHYHTHWHNRLGYHSHVHSHQERSTPSLKSIISVAFVLGFLHEEEFVILALAASQSIDPITLTIAYALSVSAALIGVTLICMKFYQRFQYKVIHYSKYLPKITAILLIFMGLTIVIGVL